VKRPGEAVPNHLLRSARESRGWTQEELAEKIGTTSVTISRWESGITFPSRYFRKKLSTLYGQSIRALGLLPEDSISPPLTASSPAVEARLTSPTVSEQETEHLPVLRPGPIFLFNESLTDSLEMYGRRRERDILLNRTYRKASTSIVGPRRIGKTWLVDYVRLVASRELSTRFCIGYLDATMPSCKTVDGFVNGALEELDLPSVDHGGLVALEKGLKLLKSRGMVPVLCIDEFEGLSNRQEFTLDFFRGLRAMAHSYGLVLIAVSRQPLSVVVGKDVETSGFFNIFEQVMLEPFNVEEATVFIREKSKQANFTEQESQCLWKYGEESEQEWPALRLQLVGKMLLEERDQPKDDDEADSIKYWQRFEQKLEKIYREVVY
jgi:transcriptional regulator with XRE-family HTH domain